MEYIQTINLSIQIPDGRKERNENGDSVINQDNIYYISK